MGLPLHYYVLLIKSHLSPLCVCGRFTCVVYCIPPTLNANKMIATFLTVLHLPVALFGQCLLWDMCSMKSLQLFMMCECTAACLLFKCITPAVVHVCVQLV